MAIYRKSHLVQGKLAQASYLLRLEVISSPRRVACLGLLDPNFVRGLSFTDVLILASRTALFDTSYHTRRKIVQCFDQECERYQKEGAKESFY